MENYKKPPEKVKTFEEAVKPIKNEAVNTKDFLNDINSSFDEVKADSTHAVLDHLDKSLDNAIQNQDFENAEEIKNKIEKLY